MESSGDRQARRLSTRRRKPVRLYQDPREHSPQMTRASGSCAFPATGTNPISLLTHSTALQKEGPAGREGPEAGPEPSCGDQRSRSRATREARTHGPGRGARRCGKARPGGRGVRRGRGARASPSLPGGRRRRGPAVARENALPGHERAFQ